MSGIARSLETTSNGDPFTVGSHSNEEQVQDANLKRIPLETLSVRTSRCQGEAAGSHSQDFSSGEVTPKATKGRINGPYTNVCLKHGQDADASTADLKEFKTWMQSDSPIAISDPFDTASDTTSECPSPPDAPEATRGPKARSYYCTLCHRSFPTSRQLEQHARATFHRVYICPHIGCTKSYYRRDVFVRHKATHNKALGEHACWMSKSAGEQKSFKRKDHLAQHIKLYHEGPDYDQQCLDATHWSQEGFDFSAPMPMPWDVPLAEDYTLPSPPTVKPEHLQEDVLMKSEASSATISMSPSCPTSQPEVKDTAVIDLQNALAAVLGRDTFDLCQLKDRLCLGDGCTKEQTAGRILEVMVHGIGNSVP